MLYRTRVEPNRYFLRILTNSFFAASPKAETLLKNFEASREVQSEIHKRHFHQVWKEAAEVGPLSEAVLQNLHKKAELNQVWESAAQYGPVHEKKLNLYAAQAYSAQICNAPLSNAKGMFFAHMIEFVQNLKIPTGKFRRLQDTPETHRLGQAVRVGLSEIVSALRDDRSIQDIILNELIPSRLAESGIEEISVSRANVSNQEPANEFRPYLPVSATFTAPLLH